MFPHRRFLLERQSLLRHSLTHSFTSMHRHGVACASELAASRCLCFDTAQLILYRADNGNWAPAWVGKMPPSASLQDLDKNTIIQGSIHLRRYSSGSSSRLKGESIYMSPFSIKPFKVEHIEVSDTMSKQEKRIIEEATNLALEQPELVRPIQSLSHPRWIGISAGIDGYIGFVSTDMTVIQRMDIVEMSKPPRNLVSEYGSVRFALGIDCMRDASNSRMIAVGRLYYIEEKVKGKVNICLIATDFRCSIEDLMPLKESYEIVDKLPKKVLFRSPKKKSGSVLVEETPKDGTQCCVCFLKGHHISYGPLIGFKKTNVRSSSLVWVHLYCIFYTSNAVTGGGEICNVNKRILQCKSVRCAVCGKGSATIGCHNSQHRRAYHLPCLLKCNWEPCRRMGCDLPPMDPCSLKSDMWNWGEDDIDGLGRRWEGGWTVSFTLKSSYDPAEDPTSDDVEKIVIDWDDSGRVYTPVDQIEGIIVEKTDELDNLLNHHHIAFVVGKRVFRRTLLPKSTRSDLLLKNLVRTSKNSDKSERRKKKRKSLKTSVELDEDFSFDKFQKTTPSSSSGRKRLRRGSRSLSEEKSLGNGPIVKTLDDEENNNKDGQKVTKSHGDGENNNDNKPQSNELELDESLSAGEDNNNSELQLDGSLGAGEDNNDSELQLDESLGAGEDNNDNELQLAESHSVGENNNDNELQPAQSRTVGENNSEYKVEMAELNGAGEKSSSQEMLIEESDGVGENMNVQEVQRTESSGNGESSNGNELQVVGNLRLSRMEDIVDPGSPTTSEDESRHFGIVDQPLSTSRTFSRISAPPQFAEAREITQDSIPIQKPHERLSEEPRLSIGEKRTVEESFPVLNSDHIVIDLSLDSDDGENVKKNTPVTSAFLSDSIKTEGLSKPPPLGSPRSSSTHIRPQNPIFSTSEIIACKTLLKEFGEMADASGVLGHSPDPLVHLGLLNTIAEFDQLVKNLSRGSSVSAVKAQGILESMKRILMTRESAVDSSIESLGRQLHSDFRCLVRGTRDRKVFAQTRLDQIDRQITELSKEQLILREQLITLESGLNYQNFVCQTLVAPLTTNKRKLTQIRSRLNSLMSSVARKKKRE